MGALRRCSDITLMVALLAWLASASASALGQQTLAGILMAVFGIFGIAAAALWCVYCIARAILWIQEQKGQSLE